MRLVEITQQVNPDTEDQSTHTLPNGLQLGQVYEYSPRKVTSATERPVHILTTYSFEEGHSGEKNYSIEPPRPIYMKILKYDHQDDDRILRVRIMSDPEQIVKRFSIVRKAYTKNDKGEIVQRRLKDLPEFVNLDALTDDEFQEKYGRPRMDEDHGLVGYVYVDNQLQGEVSAGGQKGGDEVLPDSKPVVADGDGLDKLERAIALYRANRHKPRKLVIKMLMTALSMTYAGASSYYTKAMHAVEEEMGGLDDRKA